jgi:hypothetical protein
VDLFDPVTLMTNNPAWERRMMADLPSRQRMAWLLHESSLQRRLTARPRTMFARRIAKGVVEILIRAGERLRASATTASRPAASVTRPKQRT